MKINKNNVFSIVSWVIISIALLGAYFLVDFSNKYFLNAINPPASNTMNSAKGIDEKEMNQVISELEKKIDKSESSKITNAFD